MAQNSRLRRLGSTVRRDDAFSPRGIVGAILFLAVVALVCIWFFRFAPYGDLWASADDRGMDPWKLIVLVVIVAVAWGAFRLGLIVAGG